MDESKYYECIVKKKAEPKDTRVPMLLFAGAVVLAVVSIFITAWGLVPAIALAVVGALKWGKRNVEYEYFLMDGELTIDAVYNQSSRKKLEEIQLKNAVWFAREDDPALETYKRQNLKKADYSSGEASDEHWALVTQVNNQKLYIRMTPPETMHKEIRRQMRLAGVRMITY